MKIQLILKTKLSQTYEEFFRKEIRSGFVYEFDLYPEGYSSMIQELNLDKKDIVRVSAIVEERGGGASNTGSAQVVCLTDGARAASFALGSHCWGPHAIFSLYRGIILSSDYHNKRQLSYTIEINFFDISVYDRLITKNLYTTRVDSFEQLQQEIPARFENLLPALRALFEKTTCYHCRCHHY